MKSFKFFSKMIPLMKLFSWFLELVLFLANIQKKSFLVNILEKMSKKLILNISRWAWAGPTFKYLYYIWLNFTLGIQCGKFHFFPILALCAFEKIMAGRKFVAIICIWRMWGGEQSMKKTWPAPYNMKYKHPIFNVVQIAHHFSSAYF